MDEEVAESWEEAADSGVNNETLYIPSVNGEYHSGSFFKMYMAAFRSSHTM